MSFVKYKRNTEPSAERPEGHEKRALHGFASWMGLSWFDDEAAPLFLLSLHLPHFPFDNRDALCYIEIYFVPHGTWGNMSAISSAINILSLTGRLPRIIHKFAQNPLLLLCGKVFWISGFKTVFFLE